MPELIRILVVDDEVVVLQSVTKVLKSDDEHQFLIDFALSAFEGLELIRTEKYDIVVTDLMMPRMDGLEFIEQIRKHDESIRIIMITGYATMHTAAQALQLGAYDYIAKPFTKQELRQAVKIAASSAAVMHRRLQHGSGKMNTMAD